MLINNVIISQGFTIIQNNKHRQFIFIIISTGIVILLFDFFISILIKTLSLKLN